MPYIIDDKELELYKFNEEEYGTIAAEEIGYLRVRKELTIFHDRNIVFKNITQPIDCTISFLDFIGDFYVKSIKFENCNIKITDSGYIDLRCNLEELIFENTKIDDIYRIRLMYNNVKRITVINSQIPEVKCWHGKVDNIKITNSKINTLDARNCLITCLNIDCDSKITECRLERSLITNIICENKDLFEKIIGYRSYIYGGKLPKGYNYAIFDDDDNEYVQEHEQKYFKPLDIDWGE